LEKEFHPKKKPPMPSGVPGVFRLRGGTLLKFVFANPRNVRALKSWAKSIHPDEANPLKLDAVEFSTLASRRWREEKAKRRVANSIQELKDLIQDSQQAEIAVLILARAPGIRGSAFVGLCHFRRTWCNNLCVDFLTAHPLVARNPKSRLHGVGTALLYFVMCVAIEIKASAIWFETTQNSAPYYRSVFKRPKIRDLVLLTRKQYTAFRSYAEKKHRLVK
jgi:hypothetical protein